MNIKVAIKSNNTKEHGARIIKYLESLGGKNISNYSGYSMFDHNMYYFITKEQYIITYEQIIPEGYTEIQLPEETKELTFPRKMLVWNDNEDNAKETLVFGIFPNRNSSCKVIGDDVVWRNAKELPDTKQHLRDEIQSLKDRIEKIEKELY